MHTSLSPSHTHRVKSDDFTGSEAKKHSKLVQIPNKTTAAFRG